MSDKPRSAKPWLRAIKDAEKAFEKYQERCKNIEKLHGELESLADVKGDREFQIFWANMEVMRPSIYQRPPQPVVMPRHTDTGEVPRKAAEMLERALEFDVEDDELHEVMLQVRDDLAIKARGVLWVLDNGHAMHLCRGDFLHDPARKWSEVTWVARCVYFTKKDGIERFGDGFETAEFQAMGKNREDDYQSTDKKARVWEIWSKDESRIIYVTEGVDTILEENDPYIDVKGFFPCPKPAYGTLQADTLLPVPDVLYYRDQIDEIKELTARISSLAESLRLKGFYAAGVSEIGEAVEKAMKLTDDKAVLVPVSNLAALGSVSVKDSIVWLPVKEVADVIEKLILLRRQMIDDVYEITGLSDIMRGVTDAQETLGAQNLKAQFGSIRVREKQNELVRVALDAIRIKGEIFAETMPIAELAAMAGMKLPTQAEAELIMARAQQSGQPAPQLITIEQVEGLLRNQRLRPFTMEIETDSTIAPNEQLEKETRIEFLQAMGSFFGQAMPVIESYPQATELMAELMKFGAGAFRANRDLGGVIENFINTAKGAGNQQQDNGEAAKAQVESQKVQLDAQIRQQEVQLKGQELQLRMQEIQSKRAEAAEAAQARRYDAQVNASVKQYELMLKAQDLGIKQDDQTLRQKQAEIQTLLDIEELKIEREQKRPAAIGDT